MTIISSKELISNQKRYFDLADEGRQIVIKRERKPTYTLTPVIDNDLLDDDDLYFTAKMEEKIKRALAQAERQEGVICKTYEESLKLLESL